MLLTVSGIQVHYEIVGDSREVKTIPPVLFLHGWGGTHQSLRPLASDLQDNCSCYLVDLPGFGRSGDPPPTWGVKEYTDALKLFIDEAGLSRPVAIIGHSFGGALALSLAARYPDTVSKLVVCAPSWHRQNTSNQSRTLSYASRILHRFPLVRKIIYTIFFPQSDMMRKPHLEANFKKIVREDLTEVVQSVRQKTLILWGRSDTYVPVTDALLLHRYIKSSILSIFPGIGHDLPLRHSEDIISSIHTFLTTTTTS